AYPGIRSREGGKCGGMAMLLKSFFGTNDLRQKSNMAIWPCYSEVRTQWPRGGMVAKPWSATEFIFRHLQVLGGGVKNGSAICGSATNSGQAAQCVWPAPVGTCWH